ncbi:related to MEIOTIC RECOMBINATION PROTEIN REC12 [Phialocephala subalpina]|uniref:DNA topoisomerase (ATP-hydrolyzing) n=1 Tax=Phialocephala subalpina TaxID=576137 RepID=A0A1L7WV21_9HELO|nr:related to MEIOTIC RECOMBINATION PROTEIN REC12 [Phialocephala subalpina]
MDIDLLSDLLEENQSSFHSQLLQDLPNSRLTTAELPGAPGTSTGPSRVSTKRSALPSAPNRAGAVILKIENIFESIVECVMGDKKELVIQLKTRSKKAKDSEEDVNMELGRKSDIRRIKFPSKGPREAWRFGTGLASHSRAVTRSLGHWSGYYQKVVDMYYREPELFMKQGVVDRYVDDIAYTFGVNREALNVVAAAKGLIVGSLSTTRKDGSRTEYGSEPEVEHHSPTTNTAANRTQGMLVPKADDVESIDIGTAQWATFRTIAACEYWRHFRAGNGIIITAKGYPDIQTRQFLRLLSTSFPHIPIFALVDFDPDGIGIISTYKHGSKALAHETNLAVPSIQWLGIRSSDFLEDNTLGQGLLTLSKRDRNIAKKMLTRHDTDERDEEWRRELQMMLMLNMKAEIQIVGNEEKLGEWLDGKLRGSIHDADGDILMS